MVERKLLMLIISGWGIAPESQGNLFYFNDHCFLEDLTSIYPTYIINNDDKLNLRDFYKILATGSDEENAKSVSAIISGHEIEQHKIADADRYGLITRHFNRQKMLFDYEKWHYIPFPPTESLKSYPETTLPSIMTETENLLKSKQNCFIISAISTLSSMSSYSDAYTLVDSIKAVEKFVLKLAKIVLDRDYNMLITSDGGFAEQYIDLDNKKIQKQRSANPLPVLYVSRSTEGIKANCLDHGIVNSTNQCRGEIYDVAPTILNLLNIHIPVTMRGNSLFKNL